jgi:outer membrane murein-binding lipoprotein Lpp
VSDLVKGLREAASGKGGLDYGDLWAYCDEAADEIERLHAEIAALRSQVNAFYLGNPHGAIVASLEAERDRLREDVELLTHARVLMERTHKAEAELAEARRDAERYRWLRDEASYITTGSGNDPAELYYDGRCYRAPDLDAAIDAARGET